jgi:hypothetical protein
VALGVLFEAIAAAITLGDRWFSDFGVLALAGPLLLLLPAFLVKNRSSVVVVLVASAMFTVVAGLALILAAVEPFAAIGPLIVLSFAWALGLAVIVCVTLIERPRHA